MNSNTSDSTPKSNLKKNMIDNLLSGIILLLYVIFWILGVIAATHLKNDKCYLMKIILIISLVLFPLLLLYIGAYPNLSRRVKMNTHVIIETIFIIFVIIASCYAFNKKYCGSESFSTFSSMPTRY
jgi:cation transport ATPase